MSEHWKRSVNFRNLNSKVKGNVRPGEEQLGDGIVRPSYDVTAQVLLPHILETETGQRW